MREEILLDLSKEELDIKRTEWVKQWTPWIEGDYNEIKDKYKDKEYVFIPSFDVFLENSWMKHLADNLYESILGYVIDGVEDYVNDMEASISDDYCLPEHKEYVEAAYSSDRGLSMDDFYRTHDCASMKKKLTELAFEKFKEHIGWFKYEKYESTSVLPFAGADLFLNFKIQDLITIDQDESGYINAIELDGDKEKEAVDFLYRQIKEHKTWCVSELFSAELRVKVLKSFSECYGYKYSEKETFVSPKH